MPSCSLRLAWAFGAIWSRKAARRAPAPGTQLAGACSSRCRCGTSSTDLCAIVATAWRGITQCRRLAKRARAHASRARLAGFLMSRKRDRDDRDDEEGVEDALMDLQRTLERGTDQKLRVRPLLALDAPQRAIAASAGACGLGGGARDGRRRRRVPPRFTTLPTPAAGVLGGCRGWRWYTQRGVHTSPCPSVVQALERVCALVDPADDLYSVQRALVGGDASFYITELLADASPAVAAKASGAGAWAAQGARGDAHGGGMAGLCACRDVGAASACTPTVSGGRSGDGHLPALGGRARAPGGGPLGGT